MLYGCSLHSNFLLYLVFWDQWDWQTSVKVERANIKHSMWYIDTFIWYYEQLSPKLETVEIDQFWGKYK